MAECRQHSFPILGCWQPSVVQAAMLPVRILKGVRRDSSLRRYRLEPVPRLRMAQDIPIVENQRFERHASSNLSCCDDLSELSDPREGNDYWAVRYGPPRVQARGSSSRVTDQVDAIPRL